MAEKNMEQPQEGQEAAPSADIPQEIIDFNADLANQLDMQNEQLQAIENEQKKMPLVGERLPFDIIVMEYDEETTADFLNKAKELSNTYDEVRQIRGDGNCFYRSVLIGLLEIIGNDQKRAQSFLLEAKAWKNRLIELNFPEWTTNDFCDVYIDWLTKVVNNDLSQQEIKNHLNDDGHANYLIIFMRLITSGYLKENRDAYEPFIASDELTFDEYCAQEVEAMWKDADHICVQALALACKTSLRIEYMDRIAAPNGGWHYDIPEGTTPEICLLYRPGHYDIIYRK